MIITKFRQALLAVSDRLESHDFYFPYDRLLVYARLKKTEKEEREREGERERERNV